MNASQLPWHPTDHDEHPQHHGTLAAASSGGEKLFTADSGERNPGGSPRRR